MNVLIDLKLEKTIFNFVEIILKKRKTLFVGKTSGLIYLLSEDALSGLCCWLYYQRLEI